MGLGSCNKIYEAVNLATNKKCLLKNIYSSQLCRDKLKSAVSFGKHATTFQMVYHTNNIILRILIDKCQPVAAYHRC